MIDGSCLDVLFARLWLMARRTLYDWSLISEIVLELWLLGYHQSVILVVSHFLSPGIPLLRLIGTRAITLIIELVL